MYCKKCGKEIRDNIKYCNYCGAKIQEEVKNTVGTATKRSPNEKIICLVAVFLFLLAVVIAGLVMVSSDKDGEERLPAEEAVTEMVEASESGKETVDSEEGTEALEEPSKNVFDLSGRECDRLMDKMRKNEFAKTEARDAMLEISNVIVESRIAEDEGIRLSDLTDDEKNSLNYLIGKKACSGDGIFEYELEFDDDMECDAQSLKSVARDAYGADDLPETDSMLVSWTGDGTIAFMFADGDEVLRGEGIQLREEEDCYLATLPVFKYDNISYSGTLTGYADVLFAKNESSRFGVTAVYARTRYVEDIHVDYVETSSVLESQEGKTYDGNNLIDGDYCTAWVEGVNGVGVDETITLHLDKPTEVYGILLYNGYLDSVDLYNKNGKVTKVSVDFGQGQVVKKEIDTYAPQTSEDSISEMDMNIGQIALDQSIVTDTITITITDAVAGDKYDDTCMSEVVVY